MPDAGRMWECRAAPRGAAGDAGRPQRQRPAHRVRRSGRGPPWRRRRVRPGSIDIFQPRLRQRFAHLEKLIGPIKVIIDAYQAGELDEVHIAYTRFVNTMRQEPVIEPLLPLSGDRLGAPEGNWDYLYEPDAQSVIDELLVRYVDAIIYQAVAENMASEQSARMVAMKAATDNAGSVIKELQLVYNKARQAAITKEISEIVGGAAAIAG